MKSVILYGDGLGWLKINKGGKSVPSKYFEFFVENLLRLGYHGMFRDEKACEGVKYDPPAPPLSEMKTITLNPTFGMLYK